MDRLLDPITRSIRTVPTITNILHSGNLYDNICNDRSMLLSPDFLVFNSPSQHCSSEPSLQSACNNCGYHQEVMVSATIKFKTCECTKFLFLLFFSWRNGKGLLDTLKRTMVIVVIYIFFLRYDFSYGERRIDINDMLEGKWR